MKNKIYTILAICLVLLIAFQVCAVEKKAKDSEVDVATIEEKVIVEPTKSKSVSSVVKSILPSVVQINTIKVNSKNYNKNVASYGSGLIITDDGYIVTNSHVVANAEQIFVKLNNNSEYRANVVGSDKMTDIALLKINTKNKLTPVRFDKKETSSIGDNILVIGNPYNLGISVSSGIISAMNRKLSINYFLNNFIQTDAMVNDGNSGGAMFNLEGKVIGMVSYVYSHASQNNKISFAITAKDLISVIEELKQYGYVQRGWTGITVEDMSQSVAKILKQKKGVVIVDIASESSLYGKMQISDILHNCDGKPINSASDFYSIIGMMKIGSTIKCSVFRNDSNLNFNVKIEENKFNNNMGYEGSLESAADIFDMILVPINKDLKRQFNIIDVDKGMYVVSLKEGGMAMRNGIKEGDIVISINQILLEGSESLQKVVQQGNSKFVLIVKTNNYKNKIVVLH